MTPARPPGLYEELVTRRLADGRGRSGNCRAGALAGLKALEALEAHPSATEFIIHDWLVRPRGLY